MEDTFFTEIEPASVHRLINRAGPRERAMTDKMTIWQRIANSFGGDTRKVSDDDIIFDNSEFDDSELDKSLAELNESLESLGESLERPEHWIIDDYPHSDDPIADIDASDIDGGQDDDEARDSDHDIFGSFQGFGRFKDRFTAVEPVYARNHDIKARLRSHYDSELSTNGPLLRSIQSLRDDLGDLENRIKQTGSTSQYDDALISKLSEIQLLLNGELDQKPNVNQAALVAVAHHESIYERERSKHYRSDNDQLASICNSLKRDVHVSRSAHTVNHTAAEYLLKMHQLAITQIPAMSGSIDQVQALLSDKKKAMMKSGITTLGELCSTTAFNLLSIKGIGPSTLEKTAAWLSEQSIPHLLYFDVSYAMEIFENYEGLRIPWQHVSRLNAPENYQWTLPTLWLGNPSLTLSFNLNTDGYTRIGIKASPPVNQTSTPNGDSP